MKTTIYWFIAFILALGLLTIAVALFPKGQAKLGFMNGKLGPCPNTPNCVCSEESSTTSYIEPLSFSDTADDAWQRLKQVVVSSGGSIQTEEDGYLWVSFTTKWLRFVDDVELRMDANSHVIHVRSASRLGRSDFGVNRKRVEMLRLMLNGSSAAKSE